MIDDELGAKLDQCKAEIGEVLPGMWWVLYQGCMREGFTEQQAMDLVRAYIEAPH